MWSDPIQLYNAVQWMGSEWEFESADERAALYDSAPILDTERRREARKNA